jgi:protein-tyrosine phosphatase
MILDFDEVIANRLWVGTFIRPEEVKILQHIGITSVFSVQSDWDLAAYNLSEADVAKACALGGIDFCRFPVPDFDRNVLAIQLPEAVDRLQSVLASPLARAYVHCTAGINRGPTLAAAFLIKANHMSAQEAYNHILSRRNCSPYLDILEEYAQSLKEQQC